MKVGIILGLLLLASVAAFAGKGGVTSASGGGLDPTMACIEKNWLDGIRVPQDIDPEMANQVFVCRVVTVAQYQCAVYLIEHAQDDGQKISEAVISHDCEIPLKDSEEF